VKDQKVEVARFLLSKTGIDVNCRDSTDTTPLHFAAQNGNLEIGEMLLEKQETDVNCLTVLFSLKKSKFHRCTSSRNLGTSRSLNCY
jgi:ankyrin repeat protein